jgi:hypothetical protein
MEHDSTRTARIAALKEEIHSIHAANALYWKQGENQTRAARAEYQRRQDRLEEIRSELAQLRSVPDFRSLFRCARREGPVTSPAATWASPPPRCP